MRDRTGSASTLTGGSAPHHIRQRALLGETMLPFLLLPLFGRVATAGGAGRAGAALKAVLPASQGRHP